MSGSARRVVVSASGAGALVAALCLCAPPAVAADAGGAPAPVSPPTLLAARSPLVRDSLDGRIIRRVDVRPLNVYEPVPPGRLGPLYSLANHLHIRTRGRTVREQLLFAPGERWSHLRADETERNLRALNYLNPSPIVAQLNGDSVDVMVETRDIWSTTPEFSLESFEGRAYGSIAFTERNLFGYGKEVSIAYREVTTGIGRSISYRDPGIAGTRLRLGYGASKGTLGHVDQFEVGLPFFALDTRSAFGLSGLRTTSEASLFQDSEVAAEFERGVEQFEAWWGNGWSDGETIRRLIWSYRSNERRFGPSTLEPGAPPEFDGGRELLNLHRLAVEWRVWRPHYIERHNVDRLHLTEDFEVGPSLSATIGWAPEALGSTAGESYTRLRLDCGTEAPVGFGWVRADVSTRIRGGPVETVERLDARWIAQRTPKSAFVLAALGTRGSRMPRDYQVAVGGLNGLRAYPVQALAGTRLWRLNAEQRLTLRENAWEIVTLGAAVFTDAARAWGPGADGTDWFVSAGMGLRFSLPQWSLGSLLRLDVAFPLSPTRDGERRPVLSIGSNQAF